jgi:hypothetical protein
MKKLLAIAAVLTIVSGLPIGTVSAASQVKHPQGCKTVSYVAVGSYYSQGRAYKLTNDTLTIQATWCYANNQITSDKVSYATTIPAKNNLRLTKTALVNKAKTSLVITVNGSFNSGILNNTGMISAAGTVTSNGTSSFSTLSGNGG